MKLFKKEIIKSIKLYLKDLSNEYEINENEFYDSYLNKYLKRNKKTTAYMMFVKNMHKEYEDESKEKINFVDKAKLIGSKWGTLTDKEREIYKSQADINNRAIAQIAREAGAPKEKRAGILLKRKIGDSVVKGDVLFEIFEKLI